MNFIYYICPEKPQLAKYCEGFFNYLTYGYKTWSRDRYVSSSPAKKEGQSRLLINKNAPPVEEMKAGDPVLERIYEKVITSDCYEHQYTRIDEHDIDKSRLVVFITSKDNPKRPPTYLYTKNNSVVVWKVSNITKLSANKYNLLETLIRRMVKPTN
tara:strand:+ start:110 stop:577 length:468 start_codon:yes stop_codon:yes gene_type:complete